MLWQRGKAYSQDLRERVLARADRGDRVGQIARALQVSVSYVSKVLSRRRETGETAARPQCNHVPPKLADLHDAIRGQVAAKPDATLAELRAWLTAEHKATASDALMCKTMRTLDLTRKKVAARQRTGSRGCRQGARGMAREAAGPRARQAGVHRRDLDQDQHDAPGRPGAARRAPGRRRAVREVADLHIHRRAAQRRLGGARGV